jgi:DNA-binding NtrC family response regulator
LDEAYGRVMGEAHPPGEGGASPIARFERIVESPLRGGILRYLAESPMQGFDIESLMQVFGQLRRDVENCVDQLVSAGLVLRLQAAPPVFSVARPENPDVEALLEAFLKRPPAPTVEDQSPSARRFRELIGRDEKMLVLLDSIRTVAKSDISVLLLGPTGSGKEIVARMVHELSSRRAGRFQAVSCAALPESLFESEVFGYEKGAFTGATEARAGRFELADGGTLLLDEVAELARSAQAKLLRVLEERRIERLGGSESIAVDFRLVSTSNRRLGRLVSEGCFRSDLFYRMNAFTIELPALDERRGDIPLLAVRFLARYCADNMQPPGARTFSSEALDLLASYSWPGNIRELESTVCRAALSAAGPTIRPADIRFLHRPSHSGEGPERLPTLREAERAHILRVLEATAWNKREAADILEIGRGTLYRKIAEYRLGKRPATTRAEARKCQAT